MDFKELFQRDLEEEKKMRMKAHADRKKQCSIVGG